MRILELSEPPPIRWSVSAFLSDCLPVECEGSLPGLGGLSGGASEGEATVLESALLPPASEVAAALLLCADWPPLA